VDKPDTLVHVAQTVQQTAVNSNNNNNVLRANNALVLQNHPNQKHVTIVVVHICNVIAQNHARKVVMPMVVLKVVVVVEEVVNLVLLETRRHVHPVSLVKMPLQQPQVVTVPHQQHPNLVQLVASNVTIVVKLVTLVVNAQVKI
jgi:hypothetical protein